MVWWSHASRVPIILQQYFFILNFYLCFILIVGVFALAICFVKVQPLVETSPHKVNIIARVTHYQSAVTTLEVSGFAPFHVASIDYICESVSNHLFHLF